MNLPIVIKQDRITKPLQQWLIRSLVAFTFLVVAPLDYKFWVYVFEDGMSYFTLFKLTHYIPEFIVDNAYANVVILFVLAGFFGYLWKGSTLNHENLYHWARVFLRYRLGILLVAYGLLKLFPLQMPVPSLSNLHTNYGDFFAWKIYYHTTGITPWFEFFLGLIETLAGILFFFRKTTTLGAGVVIGFSGNVLAANLAYQMGQEYLVLLVIVIAIFLFVYDFKRLFGFLYKFENVSANRVIPEYSVLEHKFRLISKSLVGLYLLFIACAFGFSWVVSPFKYPQGKGLAAARGYYNVKLFTLDGKALPYSNSDTSRWQNVVFESWPTLSIASAKPIHIDNSLGSVYRKYDYERNFESAGVGGRRYFHYAINETNKTLQLTNKNPYHKSEKMVLSYEIQADSTLLLHGTDEQGRRIEAVLEKVQKRYMLLEGRRKPVKL